MENTSNKSIHCTVEQCKYNKKSESEEKCAISPELKAFIQERIEARRNAKANRDFALADSIREELAAKGVLIKDTREGTVYTVE